MPKVPGLVMVIVAPAKSVTSSLAGADLAHEIFVGLPESPEIKGFGLPDHRHQERSATVRPFHVDSYTEVYVVRVEHGGPTVSVRRRAGVSSRV